MQRILPGQPNTYTGGRLERAGHLREDEAWTAAAVADSGSRFVLFWRGQPVLAGDGIGAWRASFYPRPANDVPWVFLGLQDGVEGRDGVAVFAADISAWDQPPAGLVDMRMLGGSLPKDDATILVTGRAMLHWRAKHGFCAVCGARNQPTRGGYVLRCGTCGTDHFPRTDPAVIMLVVKGDQVLLGQSHRFPPNMNFYSALAGFVEPGESLEEAVRREVQEEVGVQVGEVVYHSSQPWPFPSSLMLGFYAEALSEDIVLQESEMRDAKWFSRTQLEDMGALWFDLPPETSIARRLINDWLAAG